MMAATSIALTVFFFTWSSWQQPNGEEILLKVEQQLAPLQDYTVDLAAEVDMERLRIPKMKATMYFKQPDKVHFEAAGFAMLPREGLSLNPSWLRKHYDVALEGVDTLNGLVLRKLQLAAREKTTKIRQLFLWVDVSQWTVARFETIPYQGRNLVVTFHYAKQGTVFLPDTLRAEFSAATEESENPPARMPIKGLMTIVYSNYRLNTGLADELFQPKKEEEKK